MAKLLWVCAMGSPVSPIVANFWVEQFKREALSNFPRPPEIWFRRVDDTFPKLHIYDIEHFNSRDPHGDGIQQKANLPRYLCSYQNGGHHLRKAYSHRSISEF